MARKRRTKQTQNEETVEQVQTEVVETPIVEEQVEEVILENVTPTEETPEEVVETPVTEEQVEEVVEETTKKEEVTPTKPEQQKQQGDVPVVKTFDALLAYAVQNVTEDTRELVNALQHYKTVIDSGDVKNGVKVRYTLFLAIKKLINTPNYNKFVKGFNVLNKFFMVDDGKYLGTHGFTRNDEYWIFGVDNKVGTTLIVETLNKLADPSTRHSEVKKMNMNAIFKYLDTNGVRNISRFYNL